VARKSKGVDINDLPPRYREQAKRKVAAQARNSRVHVSKKQNPKHGEVASVQVYQIDTPVSIEVYSKRRRPPDTDSIYIKPALDCAVATFKLLPDDGPEWIKEVHYFAAEKVKTHEEEETIIEFREAINHGT